MRDRPEPSPSPRSAPPDRRTRPAPIGLFVYRRPEHARRTILSLLACDGVEAADIHVFADGPRRPADADAVAATRSVAHELLGDRAMYIEQATNQGLAASIIAGTTKLCERYGRAIVVEDDLVLAPSFLRFLNRGLERYADEPRVMQVSGHCFDVPAFADRHQALLLPMTTSWGWATWKRAWDLFDPEVTGWRRRLADPAERRRFDLRGHYDYTRMLARQQAGEIDSWAVRFYYSVFANDGLGLFPPHTLVRNTGFDGSGTHGRITIPSLGQVVGEGDVEFPLPDEIAESVDTEIVFEAISSAWRTAMPRRLLRAIGHMARRVQRRGSTT